MKPSRSPSEERDDWNSRERPDGSTLPPLLNGWLQKRHQHKSHGARWAKRYFHVDEVRGTLSYAKSEVKKPTVVLPLADVTSVKPWERQSRGRSGKDRPDSAMPPHTFVISCPPVHLTVRAEDRSVSQFGSDGYSNASSGLTPRSQQL